MVKTRSLCDEQFSKFYFAKSMYTAFLNITVYYTRNSSEDEIANVNFLYNDIVHVL